MSPANRPAAPGPISTPRKILFTVLLLLMPVFFLLLVEGAVRFLIETPIVDDPFLNIGGVPSFFKTRTIDGKEYKIVTHDAAYGRSGIQFTTHKEPGSIRIFCVGASASAGWPHPRSESYSAYLQQALDRAFPDKKIEVINLSLHAYASYRVRFLFDMLRDFDPDAFIIYSGNNEFLEPRTYLKGGMHLAEVTNVLNRSATYRLGVHFYKRILFPESSLAGSDREQQQYEKWSKVARVTLTLREDPEQFDKVREHYAYNISHMVEESARLKIPAIVVTVPVNMRDWHPNVSRSGVEGDALARWKDHYDRGQAALLRGQLPEAVALLETAVELDPTHAETHFQLARAYERSGMYDAAVQSYQRAVDEDRNPFRALSSMNAALRDIAARHPNAFLADAQRNVVAAAAPHAPGFDMFLDYVHPTRAGNLVIAESAFGALVESGLLGPDARGKEFHYEAVPGEDGTIYDDRKDYFVQMILLDLYGMMHQYEALVAKAEAYKDVPDPKMKNAPRVLAVFPPYLEMRRKLLLGEPVSPDEVKRIKDGVRDYYGETYEIPDMPSEIF
jgi:tetratricopeptide (TPR) repeat protein